MKGKVSKNKFLKVVLPALLVVAIICQAVGFQAVLAKGNVATTSLMTYPNVQQYTKEAGQDFTLAENSRIFVVANEKTLNNTILLKDLKLTSSNFEAAGVLSKAPIIVFGKEENAVVNDIGRDLVHGGIGIGDSIQHDQNGHELGDGGGIHFLVTLFRCENRIVFKINENCVIRGNIVLADCPAVGCVRSVHVRFGILDIAADAARCAPVKGLPGNAVSAAADRGTLCHGKCRRKDYYENDNRNDKPSECAAFVFFFVFCVFSALR